MNKIIISIAMAAAILAPASAFAMSPGLGGSINCEPWRESIPLERDGSVPVSYQGTTICRKGLSFDDTNRRLYELEIAVSQLQQQNANLQAQLAQSGSVSSGIPGVSVAQFNALAARVTAVENTFTSIRQSLVLVVNLLSQVIAGQK